MHFEFLVEGQCELTALSILMPKILGPYMAPHTWMIHKHRGTGKFPEDPAKKPSPHDGSLLHNLSSKLRAYGKENRDDLVVVVLVDLDDRSDCRVFKQELIHQLDDCVKNPNTLFRIAIEELEAWYLGDRKAIEQAYPNARLEVLDGYTQDSICGTWELFAKVVNDKDVQALLAVNKRSPRLLESKKKWAKNVPSCMDIEQNLSPSFVVFRDGVRKLAGWLGNVGSE